MRHAIPEPHEREVFLHIHALLEYFTVKKAYHQGGGEEYLAFCKVPAWTLPWPASVGYPGPFETFCRELWRSRSGCLCFATVDHWWIFEKPADPELVDGVLILQACVPCFSVHVCDCRRRDHGFPSWNDPVPDVHIDSIWYSDDVEVRSETQGLGINGLEDRQPEQLVDIESDGPLPFECAGIYLGPHAGEKLRITVYFQQGPQRSSDGISYTTPGI